MIKLYDSPVKYENGALKQGAGDGGAAISAAILAAHNTSKTPGKLTLKFDGMLSHDITYVGIVQTARASGLKEFPVPYSLTNCHNSLCAVGGTINEDDHVFGLSAAKKYGGAFVPAHMAVIHQYAREMMAGCGKMVLGSDSHTRYGPLGCCAVGEGGPELVKQLLGRTYDIDMPRVVAVYLKGEPVPGVGPQDVALAIIGAVFENGFVKNSIMEFFGPGVSKLSVDFRLGVDVMTTETTCLSSVWETDEKVEEYLAAHRREGDYKKLAPKNGAGYARAIEVDLSAVRPMIAVPFHPSNVFTVEEFIQNAGDILARAERDGAEQGMTKLDLVSKVKGKDVFVDQGIIAGCAGGLYNNLMAAAELLEGKSTGNGGFSLSVYPASQPIYMELLKNGAAAVLAASGAAIKTAFCGPCFGAGDVPANNQLSIRHTTRNFPSREGAKPGEGQGAAVALMDSRSIAATAVNGGRLTPGTDMPVEETKKPYFFDSGIYEKRVYDGIGKARPGEALVFGPNIADWPALPRLKEDILLRFDSVINDPVTTTDELIPSGETSSYRSNPLRLAEFTLSRKDPGYVGRAKETGAMDPGELESVTEALSGFDAEKTLVKSAVFARKPGDGSAREQAASCQRVLGGGANVALEYATKRYRSNLINWGMLPLRLKDEKDAEKLALGAFLYIKDVKGLLEGEESDIEGTLLAGGKTEEVALTVDGLTRAERDVLLSGALMNYYSQQ